MHLKKRQLDYSENVRQISAQSVMENHVQVQAVNLCDLKHTIFNYTMLGRPREESKVLQDAGNAIQIDWCLFPPVFQPSF